MLNTKWTALLLTVTCAGMLMSCSSTRESQSVTDSGLIYGPGFAFTVTAPDGWALHEDAGREMNLFAVVLPENKTWESAGSRMYLSIARVDSASGEVVDSMMTRDRTYFVQRNTEARVTARDTIEREVKPQIILQEIRGVVEEPYKIISYIPEPGHVIMIGMGSMSAEDFRKHQPRYRQFVRSFRFFTERTYFLTPDKMNDQN